MSQAALGDLSGVSRPTISEIATEKRDPEDKTVAQLATAMGVEPPRIAWLDGDGNPRPDWPAPDPVREVAMKVGRAVAQAIQETINKNELWYPGDGLRDLIASLYNLAGEFTGRGIDATDIRNAIAYLEAKQGRGPKRTEDP